MTNKIQNIINNYVAESEIDEVIKKLFEFSSDEKMVEIRNSIALISSKWENIKNEYQIKGIIERKEFEVERNKIVVSCQKIAKQIDEIYLQTESPSESFTSKGTNTKTDFWNFDEELKWVYNNFVKNWAYWLGGIASLIAIFTYISEKPPSPTKLNYGKDVNETIERSNSVIYDIKNSKLFIDSMLNSKNQELKLLAGLIGLSCGLKEFKSNYYVSDKFPDNVRNLRNADVAKIEILQDHIWSIKIPQDTLIINSIGKSLDLLTQYLQIYKEMAIEVQRNENYNINLLRKKYDLIQKVRKEIPDDYNLRKSYSILKNSLYEFTTEESVKKLMWETGYLYKKLMSEADEVRVFYDATHTGCLKEARTQSDSLKSFEPFEKALE